MRPTLVLLMFLMAVSAFAADVTGKWKASMQGPDGEMQLTFNLKAEGAKLTGSVESPMGTMAISEGKVDGDNVTFTVATDQFTVVHKATVSGDEMKMKAEIGDQTMELTAKRVKE
ncbi:MAG: hypothetical protein JSU00_07150 [Acidobacteria bacterium]|nr:hypothetical protein [Acidobacteriota bacterium]